MHLLQSNLPSLQEESLLQSVVQTEVGLNYFVEIKQMTNLEQLKASVIQGWKVYSETFDKLYRLIQNENLSTRIESDSKL